MSDRDEMKTLDDSIQRLCRSIGTLEVALEHYFSEIPEQHRVRDESKDVSRLAEENKFLTLQNEELQQMRARSVDRIDSIIAIVENILISSESEPSDPESREESESVPHAAAAGRNRVCRK